MKNKAYLFIDIYRMNRKIFPYLTFFGLASWIFIKLCWLKYVTIFCSFEHKLDNISHFLFGMWIFLLFYIILFKLILWIRKFQVRNLKLFFILIVLISIITIYFDITNEFTNDKSGKYTPKAYEHDLNNAYYDLLGSGIMIFIILITSYKRGIFNPNS